MEEADPRKFRKKRKPDRVSRFGPGHKEGKNLDYKDRERLLAAFVDSGGDIAVASSAVGVTRVTFKKWCESLGIQLDVVKSELSGGLSDRALLEETERFYLDWAHQLSATKCPTRQQLCEHLGVELKDLYKKVSAAQIGQIEKRALERARDTYSPKIHDVDIALLEKAATGDVKAAELVYKKFENWSDRLGVSIDLPDFFKSLADVAPQLAIEIKARVLARVGSGVMKQAGSGVAIDVGDKRLLQ